MGTIAQKLSKLLETKADIKAAITEKGQTPGDVFGDYPEKIRAIQTGVDTSDATATASDIAKDKTAYVQGQKVIGTITEQVNSSPVHKAISASFWSGSIEYYYKFPTDYLYREKCPFYISYPASGFGNATASDVAAGKTFTSAVGLNSVGTGTIADNWEVSMHNSKASDIVTAFYGSTQVNISSAYQSYTVPAGGYITFRTNFDSNRNVLFDHSKVEQIGTYPDDVHGYRLYIMHLLSDLAYINFE